MNANWPLVRLGDYCLKIGSGATPKGGKSVYLDAGQIALIRSQNVYNETFKPDGLAYITVDAANKLKNVEVQSGDILLNITGDSVARLCLAPDEYLPARVNQHVAIIRPDPNEFDSRFLRYCLTSPKQQELLLVIASAGATRNALTKSHIESLEVCKPELAVQIWIANQLESLDKKIQLNHQINHTLEHMAQALFKSWFVDFEPVKAKIALLEAGGSQEDATLAAMTAISGKDADALVVFEREHPEQYAELKATAELFPSAMQDSELGEIPEGWRHGPLSNIATFANGKIDVCSLTPETYISTENMLENRAGISTASSLPSANSVPEFRCGHVLISNIRPYFMKIWLARFNGGRSADVLAFEALDAVTIEYVYNLLYQETFFNFMMLTSKGVKMPRGDKKSIMGWQCVHPDKKISNAFSKAVGEYYLFIEINNAQNKTLTQLRDTLLPRLLSGEITLPEAEQAVSKVENV